MSHIEELVKQYCPNGVEYKELGEVCNRQKGTPITATIMKELNKPDAPVRIFAGGNTFADVNYEDIPAKDIITKTSIIVKSRGNIGFEYYTKPFSHKNEMWSYSSKDNSINLKFIYYYLLSRVNDFQLKAKTGKLPQISTPDTDNYKVPVPPLPVQEEIVKILDAFTSLEAELEAELEARKKQYEYYRNQLLSFDENTTGGGRIKFMQLGDVATIQRGKRLTKPQLLQDGLYPVFHGGIEPLGYYNQKNRESDTVMVINVGASAGTVGYSPVDFWSSDGCFCISHSKLFLNKYLYHTLKTKEAFLQSKVRKAGIPTLDNSVVEKVVVAIPPLDEQERIVAILDKFDSLVNDISEGLPAEINARKQQYEHYRNKLLTFDKAA